MIYVYSSKLPSRNPFRFAINAFHAACHDSPSCPGVCCSPSIGLRDWEMRRGSATSIRNAMSTILHYDVTLFHVFPSSLIDWKAIWKLPTLLPGDEVDDRGLHKHGAKVLPHDKLAAIKRPVTIRTHQITIQTIPSGPSGRYKQIQQVMFYQTTYGVGCQNVALLAIWMAWSSIAMSS